MQRCFFGELFGVKIYVPVSRNEVIALKFAKNACAEQLAGEENLLLFVAHQRMDLEIHKFLQNMESSQSKRFYEYLIEDDDISIESDQLSKKFSSDKHVSKLNDEIYFQKENPVLRHISLTLLICCIFLGIFWMILNCSI
ncbi:hypothetical protein ABLB95_09250 [Acinetobacter radioresistens]|uniref:hypothetical protein n=1 Tax=Acinetobacter radioresistens TaxID=40216 RepID=UPI0032B4EA45